MVTRRLLPLQGSQSLSGAIQSLARGADRHACSGMTTHDGASAVFHVEGGRIFGVTRAAVGGRCSTWNVRGGRVGDRGSRGAACVPRETAEGGWGRRWRRLGQAGTDVPRETLTVRAFEQRSRAPGRTRRGGLNRSEASRLRDPRRSFEVKHRTDGMPDSPLGRRTPGGLHLGRA